MICSSVNRLGFIGAPFRGDGLYPFLEEIPGPRLPSGRPPERPNLLVPKSASQGFWATTRYLRVGPQSMDVPPGTGRAPTVGSYVGVTGFKSSPLAGLDYAMSPPLRAYAPRPFAQRRSTLEPP
jgi:hypothetical protein